VDRFLSSFSYHFLFYDRLPKASLDLMLEVRHCNAIIELFTRHHVRKRPMPDFLKSFVASVKKKAKMDGDQGLLACHQFLKDRGRYEESLENLEITKRNYKLFVESRRHYHRAVDFFLERNEMEEATRVCNRHGNHHQAAEIYEQAGEYVLAARNYRDGRSYEDAVRCFGKIGDEAGIARVYERMKEFDKALAIWRRLGKTRETKRLSNKMKKEAKEGTQMELF
jgi:tetratricopeptide (TPR) repeat protein